MRRYVIVGGGLAGHGAAIELRRLDPEGTVDLIGEEQALPYDRPPLSKEILLGKMAHSTLKDADRYQELGISFHPGTRVAAIDRAHSLVRAEDGREFPYDALLLATGSRPRLLPDTIAPGVPLLYLRTAEDANRLRETLRAGQRIAIIGGGFIGLETAAAAREAGCEVCVIEAAERLLSRGLPPEVARHVHDLHAGRQVEILTGTRVSAVTFDGSEYCVTADGREIVADAVIVGIGALPNVELAEAAGIEVADGIVVDGNCRTSDPHIFAAGEVTSHPVALAGGHRRLESWKVAQAQPLVAAAAMAGTECAAYGELPWLWSDQFDLNLQMIGAPERAVSFRVRGDPSGPSWSIVGFDEADRPVSGVAVNAGRDISQLRRAMTRGTALPEDFFAPAAAPS